MKCPRCGYEPQQRRYITITKDMTMKDRFKVAQALGRILPCDIGKRAYFVNGHTQVESSEQFKMRLKNV